MKPVVVQADPIQLQLRKLREQAGLSRDKIAAKAGITNNTIYRMELGHHHSSIYFVNLYLQSIGKKLEIVDIDEAI